MQFNFSVHREEIVVKNLEHFVPQHIFECGQCFRWNREEDGSYTGVAFGRILNVQKVGKDVVFRNTNEKDFKEIWIDYFDLNTDYGKIKEYLSSRDHVMAEAIRFGYGIRILKQEPWETTISFIISTNNNIPRIKKSIEQLSEKYGNEIGKYNGKTYYSFPERKRLANLSVKEMTDCNFGYRAPYILKTAAAIDLSPKEFEKTKHLDTELCCKRLMDYSGVGPKVANCIAFFSMNKGNSFPVDVWIKRIMEFLYFHEELSPEELKQFAYEKYGDFAGYAQQYLFYYARELGIGKK